MSAAPPLPDWVTFVQALAAPAIALAATVVAWAQWRLATRKFDLDLFERRYKVYDATRAAILSALNDEDLTLARLNEYSANTADANFLFDQSVLDYLADLQGRLMTLVGLQMQSPGAQGPDAGFWDKRITEQKQLILMDLAPNGPLRAAFDHYLNIGRKRPRPFRRLRDFIARHSPAAARHRQFVERMVRASHDKAEREAREKARSADPSPEPDA